MKLPAVTTLLPERDSVNLLDHYTISAEDLAAFMVKDQQRRSERSRDRRQRRLAKEAMRAGKQF